MTENSQTNFEQMVTNLLVAVTEIKGDIKLILHQQAAADEKRAEQDQRIKEIGDRTETLEGQMAEAITAKKVMERVYKTGLALLGTAIAAIALYFQIKG